MELVGVDAGEAQGPPDEKCRVVYVKTPTEMMLKFFTSPLGCRLQIFTWNQNLGWLLFPLETVVHRHVKDRHEPRVAEKYALLKLMNILDDGAHGHFLGELLDKASLGEDGTPIANWVLTMKHRMAQAFFTPKTGRILRNFQRKKR